MPISALSPDDGDTLLDSWLTEAGRSLQKSQRAIVHDAFVRSGRLPLYLKLAFEEARRWKSYDESPQLAGGVQGVLDDLFSRLELEPNHGRILVERALAYLAAAREGLSEKELMEVLSDDEQVMVDFRRRSPKSPKTNRLPPVIWSRLHADLRRYMTLRRANGSLLLSFYHRQVREAVVGRYLKDEPAQKRAHAHLAGYFEPRWRRRDWRALAELPYQQTQAEMWTALDASLGDLHFVHAKCFAGMLADLRADYQRAAGIGPAEDDAIRRVGIVGAAVAVASPDIRERPGLTLQACANQLRWMADAQADGALVGRVAAARDWLDRNRPVWLSAEAPLPQSAHGVSDLTRLAISTALQSLDAQDRRLAVAELSGETVIYDLTAGVELDRRKLAGRRIAGIAPAPVAGRVAWIQTDGAVGAETTDAQLPGRPGERRLLFDQSGHVLVVREDHALVAWDPRRDEAVVLQRDVPSPLIVLRDNGNSDVLVVAGRGRGQMVGAIQKTGEKSGMTLAAINLPEISDGQLDFDGKFILLACKDRALRVVELDTRKIVAEWMYERQQQVTIRGWPSHCTWGRGPVAGSAFVLTEDGQIAGWNWRSGQCVEASGFVLAHRSADGLVPGRVGGGRASDEHDVGSTNACQQGGAVRVNGHSASVDACAITGNGQVASISRQDRTVRWWSAAGLVPLAVQPAHAPAAAVAIGQGDDVIVGGQDGTAWRQRSQRPANRQELLNAMSEGVCGVAAVGENAAVVAGQLDTVVQLDLTSSYGRARRHGNGIHRQVAMAPVGADGAYVSLRRERIGDQKMVLSYFDGADQEQTIWSALAARARCGGEPRWPDCLHGRLGCATLHRALRRMGSRSGNARPPLSGRGSSVRTSCWRWCCGRDHGWNCGALGRVADGGGDCHAGVDYQPRQCAET